MAGELPERTRSAPPDDPDRTLAAVARRLPEAVVLVDLGATVRWMNDAAARLFARTPAEAVGQSALDYLHGDDIELALRSLESIQAKEIGELVELRVATPTGWRLVEMVGRPVPELEPGGVLLCLRDVTGRRRF